MTREIVECRDCKGSGKVTYVYGDFSSEAVPKKKVVETCSTCDGLGKITIQLVRGGWPFQVENIKPSGHS